MGMKIKVMNHIINYECLDTAPPSIFVRYQIKRLGHEIEVEEYLPREKFFKVRHNLEGYLLSEYLHSKRLY
ncbi:hypothetical protein Q9251_03105 [Alkalihalobacillus macyae]|uniref:hypothetical protein n=1 Tax=Guptibacillus hwajinpoensis TaxID=208199 RepID=UPI00273C0909|nr:hypothetical protein [Alkalihalobacillus macyae]MDP4549864.1 hypothetical protein [Alkalihalobacillus macyae]